MISHIFRQFAFITMIIYSVAIGRVSSEDEHFERIFLRVYVDDDSTVKEYIDYSLRNASMITSRIKNNKSTVMYIHGFTENVEKESVQTVVQAYLQRKDHNIIVVDYGLVANNSYLSVAINTLRVGKVLAKALNQMKEAGFNTKRLHIVSHSLGSQVAGFIGRNVNFRIPRITGLDPAGPLFNIILPNLSSNNADFVDIIHTDYEYYGIGKPSGTVDFFPNGGKRIQPGCPSDTKFMSGTKADFCSHHYSWKFYAESLINESAFLGVQCTSLSRWVSGECNNNTPIVMGYATPSSAKGTVYLVTNDRSPFGLREQGFKLSN